MDASDPLLCHATHMRSDIRHTAMLRSRRRPGSSRPSPMLFKGPPRKELTPWGFHGGGRLASPVPCSDHAICGHRIREPLELEHLERGVDPIAEPLPCLLTEHDLVGPCLRLQPRREVGRLAEDAEIRVLAQASDD